jgi:dihydrofolate reductase
MGRPTPQRARHPGQGVDIAVRASAIRQALIANVIDKITLDIAPVLLGWGERIFDEVESFGFEPVEANSSIRCHARQVGTQQSESVGFWVQSPLGHIYTRLTCGYSSL